MSPYRTPGRRPSDSDRGPEEPGAVAFFSLLFMFVVFLVLANGELFPGISLSRLLGSGHP